MNLRTRAHRTVPISNLSCTLNLMQRYYKLSKIKKNGINGIMYFFSAKFFLYSNLVFSASFHYKRKTSKIGAVYKRVPQKSQYPNSLVNWEKFGRIA